MGSNYQYGGKKKRREKILMALICGPAFALVLFCAMFFLSHLPESATQDLRYILWPAAATGCTLLVAGADRLGKHFNLTPQEFAAPVAFSCTLCPLLTYALLWIIIT
ncbi:hypothetical protein P4C99_01290 [Pontiellaceae bacterium B1224]|nr:hypothetical protein [Pontiellaceae bacterium B1224]